MKCESFGGPVLENSKLGAVYECEGTLPGVVQCACSLSSVVCNLRAVSWGFARVFDSI